MAGRYEFGDFIASGGMAEVWRARDVDFGRDVAVKLLKPEYADDQVSRTRFEAEARHVAQLRHPNVAEIFDVGEMPTASGLLRPYLTMEYVAGKPLSELIGGGALPAARVQKLLAQAGDALGAAHDAAIVHRDVKPANLLVTPDDTLKVTDFGIARSASEGAVTVTGQVMGTPQYLSPEQARGEVASAASDVYSLGVVAFEALTGRRPFDRPTAVATALAHLEEPVPELPASVPPALAQVVRTALAKERSDRYPDATAFSAALRAASLEFPGAPTIAPPAEPPVPQAEPVEASSYTGKRKASHVDIPTEAIPVVTAGLDEPEAQPVAASKRALFADDVAAPVAAHAQDAPDTEAPTTVVPPKPALAVPPAIVDDGRGAHVRRVASKLPTALQPAARKLADRIDRWPLGSLDTLLIALGVVTLLAFVWVGVVISQGGGPSGHVASSLPTTDVSVISTPKASKSAGPLVELNCDRLRYSYFATVKQQLEDEKLKVVLNAEPNTLHKQPGQVSRITPCRDVHVGDTISVYYWAMNNGGQQ